jgi:hypothetical protein
LKSTAKKIKSILSSYTYDPISDTYIYKYIGWLELPHYIDLKEYEKLVLKESMRDYFKKSWMQLKEKRR